MEMGSGGFNVGKISILEHIPTSVTDRPADNLVAFPVPVKDVLHISCPEGALQVTVSDLSGRILYSARPESLSGKQLDVNFENFPKGMYVVSLTDRNNMKSITKVVK
jgi:hypothetical protein